MRLTAQTSICNVRKNQQPQPCPKPVSILILEWHTKCIHKGSNPVSICKSILQKIFDTSKKTCVGNNIEEEKEDGHKKEMSV